MENEVSSISKLGIVLIALAVLIGLAFGIFQISKGTANSGVNDVQEKLDGVSASTYTTYDQTTITGTMVRSAISDFEGKSCAILVANQAWINLQADVGKESAEAKTATLSSGSNATIYTQGSGFTQSYLSSGNTIPVVAVFASKDELAAAAGSKEGTSGDETASFSTSYSMSSSDGVTVGGSFINYNTILGNSEIGAAGTTTFSAVFSSYSNTVATEDSSDDGGTADDASEIDTVLAATSHTFYMGGIYFDTNKYICTSGYATDASGKTLFNNITGNLSKTGKTEFIPTGAKFQSYLIKDASGTTMGIAVTQVGN
jgi:hypothetical protein